MKKSLLLLSSLTLSLTLSLSACSGSEANNEESTDSPSEEQQDTAATEMEEEGEEVKEKEPQDLPTATYRSDQYTPGVISETIKITYDEDRSTIKKMEYWYVFKGASDVEESEIYELKFRKGEQYDSGEEVGNAGEVMLPETGVYVPFTIAEGMLDITHGAEQIQTFEIEM